MKADRLNVEAKFADVDASGATFRGSAAVFSTVDRGGDVILPGAFAASLAEAKAKERKVPLLWNHDPTEPLGYWKSLVETKDGLEGEGVLLVEDDPLARRIAAHIKAGSVSGLSIGYRTKKATVDPETGVRILSEVDLWEVSVVTFPMHDEARIASKVDADAAAHMTPRDFERFLVGSGLSRSVARALMGGGIKSLLATPGAGAEDLDVKRDADADHATDLAALIAGSEARRKLLS
ncbi:MAG: HK97 family phage prohead protease [Pseudomonadota bacterium]|nr:HK97 family phage prohead protease [Pseudomonadota bacterium]